jgi:hypothetical protein
VSSEVEILLVSGLHANETCAPITARAVHRGLSAGGERVALFHVPYPKTFLALIDDPAAAESEYSMPAGRRCVDADLDELDDDLRRRFPRATVFEFHNSEDTRPMLGIDPRKPVRDYEVGLIGPGSDRPREVGAWRNIGRDGRPGKYVIEVPACYAPIDRRVRDRRLGRLAELGAAGYAYDPRWAHYLETAADEEATRRRGYLDDVLASKIAAWIVRRAAAR